MGHENKNGPESEAPKGKSLHRKKKKTGRNKNGRRQMHNKQKRAITCVEDQETKIDVNKDKVNIKEKYFESLATDIEYKCLIKDETVCHEISSEEDEDFKDIKVEVDSQISLATENEKLVDVEAPQVATDEVADVDHTIKVENESKDIHDSELNELADMLVTGECISIPAGLVSILRAKKKFICDKYNIDIYSWGKNCKIRVNGTKRKIANFSAALEHLVVEKMQDTTSKFRNLVHNKDVLQQIANSYGVDIESSCKGNNSENISIFGESKNVENALGYIDSLTIYPGILMKKADTYQNKKRLTFSETNTRVFVDRKASMHGYFICEATEEMNFSEGHREEYVRRFGYDK